MITKKVCAVWMDAEMSKAAIVDILVRVVERIGAKILLEPEWGHVGQITYSSGIRRYFRLSTLDLNSMGASEIARDKGFARFFLKSMGYPVAEGETFFAAQFAKERNITGRGLDEAWLYAKSIYGPVFVKPNSRSRGVGVAKVRTKKEFYQAARMALKYDDIILVEKQVPGRDYRVVVLDGKVISAYERIPLSIIGDGISTVAELIVQKYEEFIAKNRKSKIDSNDSRIQNNLCRLKLKMHSVLDNGLEIRLLDNANLSQGGTSVDVTTDIHKDFDDVSIKIAHDMGLRLVGVDLMIVGDISRGIEGKNFTVLEVNSAPGLDHYAAMGEQQAKVVEELYLAVVTAMERPCERLSV